MMQTEFFGKTYSVDDDYLLFKTLAVREGLNYNFDYFPREELEASWEQYGDVDLIFVDHTYHKTTDPDDDGIDRTRSRGFVVASALSYDADDKVCIHLLIAISREFPKLCRAVEEGDINSVSMGCYSDLTCSICGKEFSEIAPCEHCPSMIGSRFNGELVFDVLRNISFYECSLVFSPAETRALLYEVVC